jgi:adenylate kinase family enzyme
VGECKKRLLARGRADDTPEDINSRLAWYETDVAPSVDFYRNNPNYNFCDVNGDQSVEDVFEDIKKQLGL